MMTSCKQHRAALVSYGRGELPPLARTHLEMHLERCPSCAALQRSLATSLETAQRFSPRLMPATMEGLIARLSPYLEMRRKPRWVMRRVAPVLALATASLAAVLVLSLNHTRSPVVAPSSAALAVARLQVTKPAFAIQRSAVAPSLHMLSGDGFDGTFERRGNDRILHMQHGFVAVAFAGGDGRHMRVLTPAASVEVVGTRFYVGIDAGNGATTVQVAEGRVRVTASGQNWLLNPADIVRINSDGAIARLVTNEQIAQYLDDPYLLDLGAKRSLPADGKPALAEADMVAQLDRAEQLSRSGAYDEAAAIYRVCAKDTRTSAQPYRALAAFELARLLGFKLNDQAQAGRILTWLSVHGEGEVLRQALLTQCELVLRTDACAALACLRRLISERSSEANLVAEARKLMERWQAGIGACAAPGGLSR